MDVPEPQSGYEAAQNFIAENKIFEVSPKLVKMEPGARCTVEMRYKHDFVGFHEMPMLLKVERGKRIRLRLQGNTRDLHERSVQLLGLSQTLSPVRIGEAHPPSQALLLRNDGPTPVHFSFDTSALEALRAENYGFEVLRVLNPSGSIAPGTNSHVNVVFRPLESTTYSVRLPLVLRGGPTYEVELRGAGVDDGDGDAAAAAAAAPVGMRSVLDLAGFSPSQSLIIPNSFATLSQDHVDFGAAVPTHATVRRCILLTNVLGTHSLHFEWFTDAFDSELVHGGMRVEPREGSIEPMGSVLVKLTYRASAMPAQMDTDITCRVMPEMGEEQAVYDEVEDLDDDVVAFARNASVDANKSRVYRKSLENRKSVVDAGTISMRNKFPRIYGGGGGDAAADAPRREPDPAAAAEGGANNENIDPTNSGNPAAGGDAAGASDEAKAGVIVGQRNSNNENVFVDDSDDRTMTMTLHLGVSGSTVHQSSLPHEVVSRYFIPMDAAGPGADRAAGGAPPPPQRQPEAPGALASGEKKDIIFEALQDIILDCIGDADVREALGGAGGAAAASTSEAAAAGAPAVAAPPTTGILHPKPAKPYAPYYVQIKSGAPSSSSAPAAPAPAAQSASGGPAGEERREAVVKSDDFRSFASFLIDNAIFGILQESAADLWKS